MALHSSRVSLELGSAQPRQLYNLHLAGTYSQTYCAQHWPSLLDPVEANFEGAPEEVWLGPSDAGFVDVIHRDSVPLIPFMGEPCNVPAVSTLQSCFQQERPVLGKAHCCSKYFRLWNETTGGSPWLLPKWRRWNAWMQEECPVADHRPRWHLGR